MGLTAANGIDLDFARVDLFIERQQVDFASLLILAGGLQLVGIALLLIITQPFQAEDFLCLLDFLAPFLMFGRFLFTLLVPS